MIPFEVIAQQLKSRHIIPFLGAAASSVGAPEAARLPAGSAFAKRLANRYHYPGADTDPLSKITQYLEEVPADRKFLLSIVSEIFGNAVPSDYQCCSTGFIGALPQECFPKVIITTNYDLLVERALEKRTPRQPYVSLSHIMRGNKYAGRFLCFSSLDSPLTEDNIVTRNELEQYAVEQRAIDPNIVFVYHMHGTSRIQAGFGLIDSVVLTEDDYVDYLAQDAVNRVPSVILEALRTSSMLFLGYSLSDWNFRVLLRRIQRVQQQQHGSVSRHWACVRNADTVEEKFWERRGVNLYKIDLEEFVSGLLEQVAGVAR